MKDTFILEEVDDLDALLNSNELSDKAQLKVRLLVAIKRVPQRELDETANLLGVSSRTVRRWLKVYREKGLSGLLGFSVDHIVTQKRNKCVGDSSNPDVIVREKVVAVLTNIAAHPDPCNWKIEFEQLIPDLFEDIDRIVANLHLNSKVFCAKGSTLTNVRQSHSGRAPQRMQQASTPPRIPEWKLSLEEGRQIGFPFKQYHPPVGFDYFSVLDYNTYVGSLILFRRIELPDISDHTLDLIDKLHPFLEFVWTYQGTQVPFRGSNFSSHEISISRDGQSVTLTSQQSRVFALLMKGQSYQEIGAALHISPRTVETHTRTILKAFGVRTIHELVLALFTGEFK